MTEIKESKISNKRFIYCGLIFALFIIGSVLLILRNNLLLDESFCVIAIDLVFFMVFIMALMQQRLSGSLIYSGTSYRRVFLNLLFCWILLFCFGFFPDFLAPVMILGFLLSGVLNAALSMALTIYFVSLSCLTQGQGIYVMFCYIFLGILSVMVSNFFRERSKFLPYYISVLSIQVLLPVIFYYFSYLTMERYFVLNCLVLGLINCLFLFGLFPVFVRISQREAHDSYELLMEDEYPLAEDIRRYSLAEFDHAKKASTIAMECARLVGAKELTCGCGAFYYRVGLMQGGDVAEGAVNVAVNHCFPSDVVDILYEYNGQKRLPQTLESAIVYMTDAILSMIEALDSETFSSSWNQSMLVYQKMNELSAQGIFDESDMGMNQFLRIRDYLAERNMLS